MASEARSQFEKIAGLVLALQSADVFARQDAEERIQGDGFEIMVRSSWHAPGRDSVDVPIEFCILLCRAGPAVRIVGDLNKYGEPVSARIEHQDRFNPFETWVGNCGSVEKILLAYARCLFRRIRVESLPCLSPERAAAVPRSVRTVAGN